MNEAWHIWPDGISPLVELTDPLFEQRGVTVYVKRDDLLAPFGGNKGRKLKYNWRAFVQSGKVGLISLGGPFSNHLYAFATLCKIFDVPGKVLIRGEADDPTNPVLKHIRDCQVDVIGLSRKEYAQRYSDDFKEYITDRFPGYYLIRREGQTAKELKGVSNLEQKSTRN